MKRVLVFGTFDRIHQGHIDFLKQAKRHGDYLIVVVARDKTVERLKRRPSSKKERERLKNIQKLKLVDEARIGYKTNPYKIIEELKPDIICLGYDQKVFTKDLPKELRKAGLKTKTYRMKAFQPRKYHSSLINKFMLDIKFIRQNPEKIKDACKKKGIDLDIDRFLEVDKKRREYLQALEDMRAQKNKANKEIQKTKSKEEKETIILKMRELDTNSDRITKDFQGVDQEFQRLILLIPNIPSEDSPVGPDDKSNKEIGKWGKIPKFNFKIKDHIQLGKDLNLIDAEAGAKSSGFRGYYLKNEAVLIHFGVLMYAVNKLKQKGFELFLPPTLMREFALIGSGHFPFGRDEVYQIGNPGKIETGENLKEPIFLAGTAEPSLLAYYTDKILNEEDLPVKMCGISQCYRSEIGSYGKDTRGLYRVHEFMKVEQVVICRANLKESDEWLDEMLKTSQEILKDLALPYRVVANSTGDMGAGKYKMYDIETWMPSRNAYGETHSDSNLTDWQTRRLNIRYRDKSGGIKFAYALNNTVIASPRILIAILENYQKKDGSIEVPKVLQKYVGFKEIK
ncbi:MAG: serine--tRNA ligase [Candidatus Nealsonbacteria bacterium]|nr:serine--tRNA ligase [Candidatus Nealsonbacteria bacterium]